MNCPPAHFFGIMRKLINEFHEQTKEQLMTESERKRAFVVFVERKISDEPETEGL